MRIIEIKALDNGAHRNQTCEDMNVPDGWAIIPEDMPVPLPFPFVNIEVEEVTYYREVEESRDVTKVHESTGEEYTEKEVVRKQEPYKVMTVTKMSEGTVPAPEPEIEVVPTAQEDVDEMLVDHELRLTILELGG